MWYNGDAFNLITDGRSDAGNALRPDTRKGKFLMHSDHTTQTDTRTIPLTKGKTALVDAADYEELVQHKWYAYKPRYVWYAARNVRLPGGKKGTVLMHREILSPLPGMDTDHIDGDGLNNTRANLRAATRSQNNSNRRLSTHNKSGFKGVNWRKDRHKWQARIRMNGKMTSLGCFVNLEEAAAAYDAASTEMHGEFARTNEMLRAREQ